MLRRALAVAPQSVPVLRRLTMLLLRQGREAEARQVCAHNPSVLSASRDTLTAPAMPGVGRLGSSQ